MEVEAALARYATAIFALKLKKSEPDSSGILEILLARDAVRQTLQKASFLSEENSVKLLELDTILQEQANLIATSIERARWQETFNPPPEAWWWFLQADLTQSKGRIEAYDWLFNLLTLIGLTGVTAYLTTFIQVFSAGGGFSFLEAFGILGQGGLLLTTLSTLRKDGRQQIEKALLYLKISPQYHARVTFAMTALLLLISVSVYNSLPKIAKRFTETAKQYYDKGIFWEARRHYDRASALLLNESDLETRDLRTEIDFYRGTIAESLGNLDIAIKFYQEVLQDGSSKSWSTEAMNNLGRAYISKSLEIRKTQESVEISPSTGKQTPEVTDIVYLGTKKKAAALSSAEAYLRMGLSRPDNIDRFTLPALHRNLGWVMLERSQYAAAEKEFKIANDLERQLAITDPEQGVYGEGLSACFLWYVLEQQEKEIPKQLGLEDKCYNARPETIAEYTWFIENGKTDWASSFQTVGIVHGYSELELQNEEVPQNGE